MQVAAPEEPATSFYEIFANVEYPCRITVVKSHLSSYLTLASVFLAGLLLGAIGMAVWSGQPSSDETKAGNSSATSSMRLERADGSTANDVEVLSESDVVTRVSQLSGRATTDSEFERLKDLVSKAANFAPESTLETALQIDDPHKRRDVLERLFNRWVSTDQPAALTALESIENLALRRHLFREASESLSRSNPVAAIQLMETSPGLGDDDDWRRAFANWAKADPEAATERMLATAHGERRRDALRALAQELASKDVSDAMEWADSLGTGDQAEAFKRILQRAAESKPELAAAYLDRLEDGEFKTEVAGRAAREWAEADLDGALEWAESLENGKLKERALGQIASELLETDAESAEALASRIATPEGRRSVMESIARLRMGADVSEARRWIEGLPEADRPAAWRGAAREWAQLDPAEAGAFAAETNDPMIREQLVEAISYTWPRLDPAAAAAWAHTLPGKAQSNAMSRVVDTWARSDPEDAAAFVSSSLEGDLHHQMTRRVVNRWKYEDVTEAAAWITTLDPGETKADAFQDVAGHWLRRDSMQASEWISSLPASAERDSAVTSLISYIEKDDPEAAVVWAETITDPKARESAYRRLQRQMERDG